VEHPKSSSFDFKLAVRTDLLEGYVGVKPLEVIAEEVGVEVSEIVKLDANENLYGAPKAVFDAVQTARFHEYPDPGQTYLRRDIADYMGVKDSNICAGAGSDDLIDIILRFVRPGPIVISTPTFGMYTYLSKISNHSVIDVPLGPAPTFEVPIQKIVETIRSNKASVVFVVSPNNPTGTVCPAEYIELLCKEQVFVVVDEAYAEFNPEVQLVSLLKTNPNLILLRTFSKWAALAGLRCGFAVACEEVIDLMLSTKQPYNVNVAADYAARAALAHRDIIAFDIQAIMKEKLVMMEEIAKFSWLKPLPSKSNFFLVKVGEDDEKKNSGSVDGSTGSAKVKRSALELWFNLRRLGILIRYFGKPPLAGYVRISAGRPQETAQLLESLKILDSSYVYQNLESFTGASSYKAILFDMDGVLADESRSYRQSIVDTCAHYRANLTLEDVTEYKASGGSNNDWVATYELVLRHSPLEVKPTLDEVTFQFEKVYQGTPESPGLWTTETLIPRFSLLKFLASRIPLAIVTGRPRLDAERFIKHHGLSEFFHVAVCAEDAPHKPDPAPVQLAIALLQTQLGPDYDLSRILMIGDTPNDMIAATKAGIEGMGIVAPSEHSNAHMPAALKQAGATCILSSLQELRLMFSDRPLTK
jgi:histidinol-phosphate aminotransferase